MSSLILFYNFNLYRNALKVGAAPIPRHHDRCMDFFTNSKWPGYMGVDVFPYHDVLD